MDSTLKGVRRRLSARVTALLVLVPPLTGDRVLFSAGVTDGAARGRVEPGTTLSTQAQGDTIPGGKRLIVGDRIGYGGRGPRFLVITDRENLIEFWRTYRPEGHSAPPAVDFSTSVLLVGMLGEQPTSGYAIDFKQLRSEGSQVQVVTRLQHPGPDEPVEMAFTQPFVVFQLELSTLPSRRPLDFVFVTHDGEVLGRVAGAAPSLVPAVPPDR